MKRLTVSINDDILREFRERAKKKFGHRKDFFSKAVDEALVAWIKEKKLKLI